ncbi:MFS general substrate transporter, partial [Meira miltonrushii]
KPIRFWLIFGSLMAVTCLTAVDMTIISTTLPTIVEELPASNISGSWVTSSFLLTTTAFQPFMGGLSDVVGRRIAIVIAVLLFMGGSALAAKAETMLILVIGRGVQGVGGGGIQTIAEIVLSDLTTLRERGIFVGLVSLIFAVSTFIAPVLGGFFSEHNWRLVFWINLPIGVVALALIIPTMKLKTPTMPFWAKIHRMDIGANLILLASVVAILVALTEGGITHPWSSWRIWVPFTTGWLGMILFFAIEFIPNRFSPDPVLPKRLFANRTAATCFLMTFVHGLLTYGLIYLLPIYFQSVKSASPLHSAVQIFPATAPGPFSAILAGILMANSGKYRMQIWIWWSITLAGCGLLCLLDSNTPTYQWVLFQLVPGFGVGALFTLTLPPIQASLPVEELAHATATFAFCRSFGSVWGIALGTNVFISVVNTKLSQIQGLAEFGLNGTTALGFTTNLQKLPEQFQLPAQNAFMSAIRTSIYVFCPAAFIGLLISFFIDELPLPDFNES